MKKVLITGATSGIGKALALNYACQGWQVFACGRNQAALNELSENKQISYNQDFTDVQKNYNNQKNVPKNKISSNVIDNNMFSINDSKSSRESSPIGDFLLKKKIENDYYQKTKSLKSFKLKLNKVE